MDTITICENCEMEHSQKIPLISTMAFRGAELWCPFCGETFGMFRGKQVSISVFPFLPDKKKKYEAYSNEYLKSVGLFSCSSTEIEGQRVDRKDIPEEVLDRARKVINSYQFKRKIK